MRNVKPLAIFRCCTAWFMSDLVRNPKDRFSCDKAQILVGLSSFLTGLTTVDDCTPCLGGYACPEVGMITVNTTYLCESGYFCNVGANTTTPDQGMVEWIMLTRPCNLHPLSPHLYIVNWGLQGYTLFFLILLLNIVCGYSSEPPQ